MKQYLFSALIAAVVAVIVLGVSVGIGLVGDQSGQSLIDQLGAAVGITRLPRSGFVARYLKASTAMTAPSDASGSLTVAGNSYLGPVVLGGNFIAGYGLATTAFTTSTTITPAQFCGGGTLFVSTNALSSTLTFPAATSSYAVCGVTGAVNQANYLYNSSTAAVITLAYGTGVSAKFASVSSTGFSSTTIPAGGIMRFDGQFIDAGYQLFLYQTPYISK
jgi:hypothetical protein